MAAYILHQWQALKDENGVYIYGDQVVGAFLSGKITSNYITEFNVQAQAFTDQDGNTFTIPDDKCGESPTQEAWDALQAFQTAAAEAIKAVSATHKVKPMQPPSDEEPTATEEPEASPQ